MADDFIVSLSCDRNVTITEKVRYNDIDVSAEACFLRLVDCNLLNVDGCADFKGLVTCDDFICNGKATLMDRMMARNAVFNGDCEVYGKINSDLVSVGGKLTASGKISSILVSVSGELQLADKLVCDNIKITGSVKQKGKLRTIDFKLLYNGKTSSFVDIKADNVFVDTEVPVPPDFALSCRAITCDTCNLSFVQADEVFCETAVIGPGCFIRVLECHDEPQISSGSTIQFIKRF